LLADYLAQAGKPPAVANANLRYRPIGSEDQIGRGATHEDRASEAAA
jgi:hypothetical protein